MDEARVRLSKINDKEKEIFERELKTAKRFSRHFNCEVFLLPPDENGNAIYEEKHSNPDTIFHRFFIDFKNAKNTDTSITRQLERGIGQADGVLITLKDKMDIKRIEHWINGKLKSLKQDHDGFIVIIENGNNNFKTFIINKKRLSIKESLFLTARRLSPSGHESLNSQVN